MYILLIMQCFLQNLHLYELCTQYNSLSCLIISQELQLKVHTNFILQRLYFTAQEINFAVSKSLTAQNNKASFTEMKFLLVTIRYDKTILMCAQKLTDAS